MKRVIELQRQDGVSLFLMFTCSDRFLLARSVLNILRSKSRIEGDGGDVFPKLNAAGTVSVYMERGGTERAVIKPDSVLLANAGNVQWFRNQLGIKGKSRKVKCGACNGSGHYDAQGSPACGACDGTGYQ